MYYAGIGARQTPAEILVKMRIIAECIAVNGDLILRSGGAKGADSAFEAGCIRGKGTCHIWRPEHATPQAIAFTSKFHPAWKRCSDYTQRLHARNAHILLGRNLDNPVKFVICWTPDGQPTGGTGQALRIAKHLGIGVFNLAIPEHLDRWETWLSDNPPF